MEHELITYPTWERYTVLAHSITNLSVKDRRRVFQLTRQFCMSPDLFFPEFGFTLGEFAVWYTLSDSRRKTRK
jgi:hypothetical protein